MFLFTTPAPSRQAPAEPAAVGAIRAASAASGVSFDYLLKTAQRESGLRTDAAASTSSARGLFQFVERTWLGLVRSDGAEQGVPDAAAAISASGRGRFAVADAASRARILALRNDPDLSARFAAVLARKNYDALSTSIGRAPTQGELYSAHFLGPAQAARLIHAAETAPAQDAARLFPEAARANRSVFYHRSGEPRTAREVYNRLVRGFDGAEPAVTAVAGGQPVPDAPAPASGNPFHSLFRSRADTPVAAAVQNDWRPLSLLPRMARSPESASSASNRPTRG